MLMILKEIKYKLKMVTENYKNAKAHLKTTHVISKNKTYDT